MPQHPVQGQMGQGGQQQQGGGGMRMQGMMVQGGQMPPQGMPGMMRVRKNQSMENNADFVNLLFFSLAWDKANLSGVS